MVNPFRSESEAYRFLLLTVGYFAAIVLATLVLGRWAGLAVFAVLTLAALYLALRRGQPEARVQQAVPRRGAEDERRILVIANETVAGGALREEIKRRAEGHREDVLVVVSGSQRAASALGLGRGRRPGGRSGAAGGVPDAARRGGCRRSRRGGRRRPTPGDRGRAPDVRSR